MSLPQLADGEMGLALSHCDPRSLHAAQTMRPIAAALENSDESFMSRLKQTTYQHEIHAYVEKSVRSTRRLRESAQAVRQPG